MSIIIWPPGHDPALPITLFYGGTERLAFDEPSWSWWRINEDRTRTKLWGITTCLKIIAKEALLPWGIKTALARLKQILMERGYVTTPERYAQCELLPLYEEILDEIIATAKRADSDVLYDAADVGSAAHEFLEKYVKYTISKNDAKRLELLAHFPADDRAANCCVAGLEFMVRHNVRFRYAERPVYSKSLRCCGTADGIALLDSCDDPACCPEFFRDSLALLDYKTSNGIYPSYLGQTAIYQRAYQEETGEHIERRFILRLGKTEGEFESWHMAGDKLFEEDLALYVHALELYKSVHLVDDRMAEIARHAKEIRAAAEKAVKDVEYAIECKDANEYLGKRVKKGCNGTSEMCQTCKAKYAARRKVSLQ